MNINRDKRLPSNQFVGRARKKDMVLLHFTAGSSVEGAMSEWLRTPDRVATSYILGKDGVVHEVMDPADWAFHLGLKGADWENGWHDERSVGIEIVNEGPLKRIGDTLYWWPNDYKTLFCHAWEMDKYFHADKPWRGFEYWAQFTKQQLAVIPALTGNILDQFDIPRAFLVPEKRLELALPEVKNFSGITTHSNWRSDKFDIGPAFDWKIIGG